MIPSHIERIAAGKCARQQAARADHAAVGNVQRDPIALLRHGEDERLMELVPLRYGRMLASPFAFFRGSTVLQAHDLAGTPDTGYRLQICGDCHLANFGGFATSERNLLFDLNDFDETHPGPWEWDLKRLAASVMVAGRHLQHRTVAVEDMVYRVVASYQRRMQQYAEMSALEVWYDKITFERMLEAAPMEAVRRRVKDGIKRAQGRTQDHLLPKLGERVDDRWRIRDAPPGLFHVDGAATLFARAKDRDSLLDWQRMIGAMFRQYQGNLESNRKQLLDRFEIQDMAFKVVGVGSVGLRCLIVLLIDAHDHPIFLQIKQAEASVVGRYVHCRTAYRHQGRRVVEGQRLMQAAGDQFIAWCTGPHGRHFYVRQLRDMKISAEIELFDSDVLEEYVSLCGWVLARAHARAGNLAPEITGYLGDGDAFARALVKYAGAYADRVEQDFERFAKACRTGALQARTDSDYAGDFSV